MPSNDSVHREACRRFHRVMAHYLAVYTWKTGADCVAIERHTIERVFQISRIKSSRREWFEEDMRPWFPYIRITNYTGTADKFAAIYLSRSEFPTHTDYMTVRQSVQYLELNVLKSIYFELNENESGEEFEKNIQSLMALLASGLVSISDVINR